MLTGSKPDESSIARSSPARLCTYAASCLVLVSSACRALFFSTVSRCVPSSAAVSFSTNSLMAASNSDSGMGGASKFGLPVKLLRTLVVKGGRAPSDNRVNARETLYDDGGVVPMSGFRARSIVEYRIAKPQRHFITQPTRCPERAKSFSPGLAQCAYPGSTTQNNFNPNGVASSGGRKIQPFQGCSIAERVPRVAAGPQPWAERWNPVGIQEGTNA